MNAERLDELGVENIKLSNGRTFIGWLENFTYFNQKAIDVVVNCEDVLSIKIFTSIHNYNFRITSTYLGCSASIRTPRTGEDWCRGNDLPDGEFNKETLVEILGAIMFYESKEIVDRNIQSASLPQEIKR
jgi:hypothetical protein